MLQAGHQHPLQLSLILRCHHREVGNGPHVADVVLTLVGRPVGTNDAGTIEHEGDRQLLDAHVVDQLVVGALKEGAVDGNDRTQPLAGHACRQGDGMLLSDAHVHVLVRNGLLKQIETGTGGHGRSDADHPTVLLTELDQGLPKHLAVAGGLGFGRRNRLAGAEIKS